MPVSELEKKAEQIIRKANNPNNMPRGVSFKRAGFLSSLMVVINLCFIAQSQYQFNDTCLIVFIINVLLES